MSRDRPLVDSFIAHLDESARAQAARTSALGMVIQDLLARAHEAWPDLDLPDEEFLAYIAERLPGNSELVSELRGVRGPNQHWFNNAIQSWEVAPDGSVHNVHA